MKKNKRKEFTEQVGRKQRRKRLARNRENGAWFGLGMFGLVGWSVAIPMILGLAVGLWLDGVSSGSISWTLMMLAGGTIAGGVHAWYWIEKERREMNTEEKLSEEEHDDE
jgi:ATP synthase protein I